MASNPSARYFEIFIGNVVSVFIQKHDGQRKILRANLKFRLDPARAHDAPAAQRFKNGEQSRCHKNQSQPQHIVHDNDSRDEAQRADDAAREASVTVEVGLEEAAHGKKLARLPQKAKACGIVLIW